MPPTVEGIGLQIRKFSLHQLSKHSEDESSHSTSDADFDLSEGEASNEDDSVLSRSCEAIKGSDGNHHGDQKGDDAAAQSE